MEKKNYKYTCIAFIPYALLQYLLLQEEKDSRDDTFYFFGPMISKGISEKIPSAYPFETNIKSAKSLIRFVGKMYIRFFKYNKYPFLKKSIIFAQDHWFLSILIGRREYALLSDGPFFLTLNEQYDSASYMLKCKRRKSIKGRLDSIFYGKNFNRFRGDNEQCTDIYLTEENQSHVLNGRKVHIQSLEELWEKSSESKRNFILDVFNVNRNDLEIFQQRTIVFFSQPMVDDGILTESEYCVLLKKIFGQFEAHKLLIKTHPRDKFNYSFFFPSIPTFCKPINSQLLQLLKISIETGVTICSTAVSTLPNSSSVIWYGPSIHPKIEAFFGTNFDISRPYIKKEIK